MRAIRTAPAVLNIPAMSFGFTEDVDREYAQLEGEGHELFLEIQTGLESVGMSPAEVYDLFGREAQEVRAVIAAKAANLIELLDTLDAIVARQAEIKRAIECVAESD